MSPAGRQTRPRQTGIERTPRAGDRGIDITLQTISPGHAVFSTSAAVAGDWKHRDQTCSMLLEFALGAAVQSLLDSTHAFTVVARRSDSMRHAEVPTGVLEARAHALIGPSGVAGAGAAVCDGSGQIIVRGSITADTGPGRGRSHAPARPA